MPMSIRAKWSLRSLGGYSVLELLVVFTIFLVLLAMVAPAYKNVKETMNVTVCSNNLRQIGLAMFLYSEDEGHYPWGFEHISGPQPNSDWTYTIQPYLNGQEDLDYNSPNLRSPIIQCPTRNLKPTNIVNTYGVHARILGKQPGNPFSSSPPYPRAFPWTERPAEVFLAADAAQNLGRLGGEARPTITHPDPDIRRDYNPRTACRTVSRPGVVNNDPAGSEQIRWRHKNNTMANFVFMDGHVESMVYGQLQERHIKITGP
jgi:prepilin-type processing-associated H-X9-DG protein